MESLCHTTWVDMLNFLVIEMFIAKLTNEKIIKEYSKEDQDKTYLF